MSDCICAVFDINHSLPRTERAQSKASVWLSSVRCERISDTAVGYTALMRHSQTLSSHHSYRVHTDWFSNESLSNKSPTTTTTIRCV